MALWPTVAPINDVYEQITHLSAFHESPAGCNEVLQSFTTAGTSNQLNSGTGTGALMMPFYAQQSFVPLAFEWEVSTATSSTASYKWLLCNENGLVVAATAAGTASVPAGLGSMATTTNPVLPPGTYYYGFAWQDSFTTSGAGALGAATTSANHSRFRVAGCKMWNYNGASPQLISAMTVGSTVTLLVPTIVCVYGAINSFVRCMVNT